MKHKSAIEKKGGHSSRFLLTRALIVLMFLGTAPLLAQDVLTLTDGTELKVKILVVSDHEIRYRDFNEAEGPLRSISKSKLFMIRYENGVKEVVNVNPPPAPPPGQVQDKPIVKSNYQKFGGPRIGLTLISPGTLADRLYDRGKNPVISQFGWQFETRIFNFEEGPSGIFEFVPLIGGMEQGMFLPSASLLVGVRGSGEHSFEVAFGPNLSISGIGVVIAVGKNFRYKNVNFPVNIAYVPSIGNKTETYDANGVATSSVVQTGHRISLLVGFNVRKR